MASDIWLRTILIVRKETRCRHIGYSFQLTARVLLYAPSHRQDSTYYGLCYTSSGALAGTRNRSMGSPHEGSIRRPIVPWANALTTELHLAPRAPVTSGTSSSGWRTVWLRQCKLLTLKRLRFVWSDLVPVAIRAMSCNRRATVVCLDVNHIGNISVVYVGLREQVPLPK